MKLLLLALAMTLAAAPVCAQSESPISGRWGWDGRTLLDIEADSNGSVEGNAYFHGGGAPVRMPIATGHFDAAKGTLRLEASSCCPERRRRALGSLAEPSSSRR